MSRQRYPLGAPIKGRGALSNREGRFETCRLDPYDDGWDSSEFGISAPSTTVFPDLTRSVITSNQSPDIPFDASLNPYRGCEHGCIYCYARPSHAYLGHSPGLDFETLLYVKKDAAALLEGELRRPSYRPKSIMLGSNTDPYQPIERQYKVTREILEVLNAFNHPVSLITKSALVLRDLDLFQEMAAKKLVDITISITTLDQSLARNMEPRASAPQRRLAVIAHLSEAGIPVSINVAPIIPALNDHELETILNKGRGAGALRANYILLRLPLEVRDLFVEWLTEHYPQKAEHVMSLMKKYSNGKEYDSREGVRFSGSGPFAQILKQRFEVTCKRLGLNQGEEFLVADHFRRPPKIGDQLSLFEV